MTKTPLPYLRPEEPRNAFLRLARAYRAEFRPDNPESQALVNTMIYIAWRIHRYRLDERGIERFHDHPGQAVALQSIRALIESLEQIGSWTLSTLLYMRRVHDFDASEAMDYQAENPELGSFRQNGDEPGMVHIPAPLPPKTKPN